MMTPSELELVKEAITGVKKVLGRDEFRKYEFMNLQDKLLTITILRRIELRQPSSKAYEQGQQVEKEGRVLS